jgi:hypothetical protein
LSGLLQKETTNGSDVPIVITTHEACEGGLLAALAEIADLDVVKADPVRLRVLELPEEGIDSNDEWHRRS